MDVRSSVAEVRYAGPLPVEPYRRGTYVGDRLLEQVVERALGARYSYGGGWEGEAEITIRLFDAPARRDAAARGESVHSRMSHRTDGAIR